MSIIWLEDSVQSPDAPWEEVGTVPKFLGRIVKQRMKRQPFAQGCYFDHENKKLVVSVFPDGHILLGTPGHPILLVDEDQMADVECGIQELLRRAEDL